MEKLLNTSTTLFFFVGKNVVDISQSFISFQTLANMCASEGLYVCD